MLSILTSSTTAYQAPLAPARGSVSTVQMSAITPGDIGTTKPLGVYDPLGLMTKNPEKYRRFQEMEIKHGRMAMAACAHVFVVGAGFKFPGYISYLSFPPLKFEDIPASPIGSWETLPQAGWAQIVCLIAIIDNSLFAQDPNLAPGDVVGDKIPWVRYSDPAGAWAPRRTAAGQWHLRTKGGGAWDGGVWGSARRSRHRPHGLGTGNRAHSDPAPAPACASQLRSSS
jgi:light-harvesting complex I chlorophyll a/b binding protein 1